MMIGSRVPLKVGERVLVHQYSDQSTGATAPAIVIRQCTWEEYRQDMIAEVPEDEVDRYNEPLSDGETFYEVSTD